MKKLLYCAAALAMAFFAGSCQQENLEPVVNGSVTYTITLPETVQTKGSSGYTEGYDLYYEVYKTADFAELEKAKVLFDNFRKPIEIDGSTRKVDVPFDLLNDQDYTILFWANKKGADWFELEDLRKVGIKASASNNNDRDAFCKMDQLENVNGSMTKSVTLTRPFAQLNIATEIPKVAYDVIPDYSYVKVTKVPTVYNVATGAATNDAVVEFKTAAVPVDKKITVDTKEYNLVAMNYVLVPEGNINVYYAIETENGIVTNTINNVPVKKNYRTNIVGNLLTSNATYTVELKPGFETPDEVVKIWDGTQASVPDYDASTKTWTIDNGAELAWFAAAVNGTLTKSSETEDASAYNKDQTVVLSADINLGGNEWTPIGHGKKHFYGTFDGAGHTISNFKITRKNDDRAALFGTVSLNPTFKNLIIEDANIIYPGEGDYYGAALIGTAYGNVTIENVIVRNSYISGNNKVAGILAHDGVMSKLSINNCHVENCVIESLNQTDGGNVGGLLGLFQTGGDQNFIKNSSVKNTVINGVNSTDSGKRANGQFVACVSAKDGQVLNIENCVLSGNTFTQNEGVTYVSPYGPFVGGDRESTGTAVIKVKDCSCDVTVTNIHELNAAILSAKEGTLIIKFANDITGTTTIRQKVGVNLIIDGCGKKFDGTFYLEGGMQGGTSPETLIFKNINFNHTTGDIDFISADNAKEIGKRYAHNVTVEDCTFAGGGNYDVVAMRYRQCFNMTVRNVEATGVHSLIWSTGITNGLTVENAEISGKNGIHVGTNDNVIIKNIKVLATNPYGYAVRADGSDAYQLSISGSDLKADVPVLIRNTKGAFNLTLSNNTLTTTRDFQLVVANNDYKEGEALVEPTGNYNVVGDEGLTAFPIRTIHEPSGLIWNGSDAKKFYITNAEQLFNAAAYFTYQTNSNEANVITLELEADIDLANQNWTPWNVMFIKVNANGHKISNLSNNFFGYAGAVTLNDLTLENVVASGNQAGTFASATEGTTFNNCVLTGTNKVTYVDAGKNENGIGVVSGVTIQANLNVEVAAGAKVTLEYNDIQDTEKTTFSSYLHGYKHTTYDVNKGVITVNGTLEIGGISYAKEVHANGDIAVTLTSNGTDTKTRRSIVEEDASIKSAIVEEGITVIGNKTFRRCYGLETVTLPSTLTEIEQAAFQSCNNLKLVEIPASVNVIGTGAFAECGALTSINIPEGVTRIEKDALRAIGVDELTIPSTVTYIGQYAFRDTYKMKEMYIMSETLESVASDAFLWAAPPKGATMTIYVKNQTVKDMIANALGNNPFKFTVEIM